MAVPASPIRAVRPTRCTNLGAVQRARTHSSPNGVGRDVDVDDGAHAGDVEAPGGQLAGHEEVDLAGSEPARDGARAEATHSSTCSKRLDCDRSPCSSPHLRPAKRKTRAALCAARLVCGRRLRGGKRRYLEKEDGAAGVPALAEVERRGLAELVAGQLHDFALERPGDGDARRGLDVDGVDEGDGDDVLGGLRERGAEEHRLPVLVAELEDLGQLVLEPEVEQPVRLVEHDDLDGVHVNALGVEHDVEHLARGGEDDVGDPAELGLLLLDRDAPGEQDAALVEVLGEA
ncbi:ATP-dependent RNA helicase RhlE, putative [Babesia caballi]|uniref:ATP-dependent RNA helicase RhlE, putative n=1 Tax=Babesia caballi TaxID=5871 RepID=A0AAV4LQ86_BABCB|nr:ATP-dependent RNA helicase RhlE, putative [Babesia caballi]